MRKLTPKQERFVEEYVVDRNGTAAAIRAGFSKRTAGPAASRLLKNVNVAAAIKRARAKLSKKTEVTQERIVNNLSHISESDLLNYFDENGCFRPLDEIPEEARRAIASIEVFEEYQGKGKDREFIGYIKKIKLWDKPKALENLGRHLGMFKDNINLTADDELLDALKGRRARAAEAAS